MRIKEFELLNDAEKEEAIWENGIFLINYNEGNNLCDVYELFKFYVSFCYELNKNLGAKITASIVPDALSRLFRIINLN